MHSRRLLDLLVLGLSALSVADATFNNRRIDVRDVKAIEPRQGTDSKSDEPAAPTSESESPTPSPSPPPSTSPPPKPSSKTLPPPSPSSTPPPVVSSTSPPPQKPSTTDKPVVPSNPSTPGQQPPKDTSTKAPPPLESSREIKTITRVTTKTNEDGSQSTLTSEVLTTATPGLAEGDKKSSDGSGMAPKTRNTVIGVVVGVGGAIILIGLGFVAWRIWGRKRNQDEQDGLMDYTSPNDGKSEVGGSMSGRTPFQSTLESYHAPTQVNQAANF